MPGLDDVGNMLFVSSIPSWDYLVEWYSDLARTKTRSSYEIREQVNELVAGRTHLTESEKIRIVYDFITENIRYSSVSFRQSGLVPQKARDVLVNRIGDCKDVATLCIAMLNEVGVKAEYVLVNTRDEGANANILPTIAFNHCIAGVRTPGAVRYLDLTANNYPLGSAPPMDFDAFSLRIAPDTREPAYLAKELFTPRSVFRQTTAAVLGDNSIAVTRVSTRTGGATAGTRSAFRDIGQQEREQKLSESLSRDFPGVVLKSLAVSNVDAPDNIMVDTYDFAVPHYVTETGSYRFLKIPWADNLEPDQALSYETRSYPYDFWLNNDTLYEHITIALPRGYVPVDLPPGTTLHSPIADYSLNVKVVKGTIVAERRFIQKKRVVPTEEYPAFRKFYTAALKEDGAQILLRKR